MDLLSRESDEICSRELTSSDATSSVGILGLILRRAEIESVREKQSRNTDSTSIPVLF